MKKIVSGEIVLFLVVVGMTASLNAEQRRSRRELLSLPPNTTTVQTKHDDIAHFTCTTRSQATISWKMETRYLSENDFGVTILLCNDSAFLKSHLFVAVTNDALRGKYECFSSDEPDMAMETFLIENDPAQEKLLSTEDTVAIILSLSIAFIIGVFIAFFLLRGNRRIKKAKAMRETARSQARRGQNGAQQENLAVEEEIG
ncbi:uncharacterized protein LOC114952651 isoform X1 [Acropora millepora]|uniref:uncharacterized protein LOC114952651 isoform X1 n=1 Tax=Acropora millepora TaxID=45264 RepID=UPI0010FC9D4D|nr:uncharacterized protein LOC114952651 isoform X1 [Acropora millepora]